MLNSSWTTCCTYYLCKLLGLGATCSATPAVSRDLLPAPRAPGFRCTAIPCLLEPSSRSTPRYHASISTHVAVKLPLPSITENTYKVALPAGEPLKCFHECRHCWSAAYGAQALTMLKNWHNSKIRKVNHHLSPAFVGKSELAEMGCEQSWLRKDEQIANLENKR